MVSCDHSVEESKDMPSLIPAEIVEREIFLLRGQNVTLDRHLAELYGVETRALNQAVKRNRSRFPDDFMFPLTREEIMRVSQSATSSDGKSSLKFSKNVMAFTSRESRCFPVC